MTSAMFLVNTYKKRRRHRRAEAVFAWAVTFDERSKNPLQCKKSLNLSIYIYWVGVGAVNIFQAADELDINCQLIHIIFVHRLLMFQLEM